MEEAMTIPLEVVCKKILRETVLDVFYLISMNKDISKSELASMFQDNEINKSQKYRFKINEALAKLEGALLIDSFTDGTRGAPVRYFLTNYGQTAEKYLEYIFESGDYDAAILKGAKIVSKKLMEADEI